MAARGVLATTATVLKKFTPPSTASTSVLSSIDHHQHHQNQRRRGARHTRRVNHLVPVVATCWCSGAVALALLHQGGTPYHHNFGTIRGQYRSIQSTTAVMSSTTSTSKNPFKRVKHQSSTIPPSTKVIGTHSGTFQADEALGVWFLRQTPTYHQSKVIRTRDNTILSSTKCDIVIDVGGIYDHTQLRYDHHQRDFDITFSEEHNTTKLSACGLVYKHYGKEVIQQFYPLLTEEQLTWVYEKMYDMFVQTVDAIDNGVEAAPTLKYHDSTNLSSRVGRLNPRWNEEEQEENGEGEPTATNPIDVDERFERASTLCGEEFLSVLEALVESQLPAMEYVERAIVTRMDVDPSGAIIKLPSGGMPWKKMIYDMERKHVPDPVQNPILFVLYTDQEGRWRVQTVSVEGQGFTNRLGLPEQWRGYRDEELSKLSGIPGCIFVHSSGFIGGNTSYEGALEMARMTISLSKSSSSS